MSQPSVTLDLAIVLGEVQELRKTLEALADRLVKAEVELGVLRAGCETMFQALELNGLLVAGEAAKIQGSNPRSEPKSESWNPSKIVWVDATGERGQYQRSQDINNLEFKTMLKDLATHKGKLSRDGYFYWVFTNGHVVGRKRKA